MGVPLSRVQGLRFGALGSPGRTPKGITLGLRLHRYKEGLRADPLILNIGQVALLWAQAVWESFPHISVLETCLGARRAVF